MNEAPATSLDDALSDTVSSMPEQSPVADILQAKAENVNAQSTPKVPENNEPVKRGRGRPRKDGSAVKSTLAVNPAQDLQRMELERAQQQALSVAVVQVVEQSGVMIAGDDGAITNPQERQTMEGSVLNYLRAKDIKDVPPALMLCVSLGLYYQRVLSAKAARPKVMKMVTWLAKLKFWSKNARAHNRNDMQRENNTSEKTA